MKKPWQEHSSKWDVPWDQRAEQNFDSDKIKVKTLFLPAMSLTALIALFVILPTIVSSISWAIKNPRFNENPHFNNCKLVQDAKHPTGSYYSCSK